MKDFNEKKKTEKGSGRMVIVIMPIVLIMSIVVGIIMINSLFTTTRNNLMLQTKLYAEKFDVLKANKTEYIENYFAFEMVNDIAREGIMDGAIVVDGHLNIIASAPAISVEEFQNENVNELPAKMLQILRKKGESISSFRIKGGDYTLVIVPLNSIRGYLLTYAKTNKVMGDFVGVLILMGAVATVCVVVIFLALARSDKRTSNLGKQLGAEEVLVKCARCLANNREFESAINELLGYLSEYYNASKAYIFQVDEENSSVSCTFEWHRRDVEQAMDSIKSIDVQSVSELLEKLDRQGFVRISDRQSQLSPNSWEYLMMFSQDIYSFLAVPFKDRREHITGFLAVGDAETNADAESFLISVASFVKEEILKKSYVDQLVELSYMDKMTKVGNRHAYVRDLDELSARKAHNVGVIFADVNGLKAINDAQGHEAGDELLIKAANLLKSVFIGENNSIYRIGGDEFVVVFKSINENDFYDYVHQILELVGVPPLISIGETWIENCDNLMAQVKVADKRMYERKSEYYRKFLPDRRKSRKE